MVRGNFCICTGKGPSGEERAGSTHRHGLHTGLAYEIEDDEEAFARLNNC